MAPRRAKPTPSETPSRTGSAPRLSWEGRAFGLNIRSEVTLAGFPEFRAAGGGHTLTLRLVSAAAILEGWTESEAERMVDQQGEGQPLTTTIDHHAGRGYLFRSTGFGAFLLSPDGREVLCAPEEPEQAWYWQSFITGQVLPAAALLQGLEILHASAVLIGGNAVAFHGFSGAGKTSLALSLTLRGAHLMADDVLALERREDDVWAHPGSPVVNLVDAEYERLGGETVSGLGRHLGGEGDISRLAIGEPALEPAPLRSIYRLDRQSTGSGRQASIVAEPAPGFQALVDLTFNTLFRSSMRRVTQLEVLAALIRSTRIFNISIPPAVDASTLAAQVESHVLDTTAGAAPNDGRVRPRRSRRS